MHHQTRRRLVVAVAVTVFSLPLLAFDALGASGGGSPVVEVVSVAPEPSLVPATVPPTLPPELPPETAPPTTAAPVTAPPTTARPTTTRPPATTTPRSVPGGDRWDQLAQCESGGNWSKITRSGSHVYGGGLQFLVEDGNGYSTWARFGGTEFAPVPWEASREQQIIVAERVLAAGGWGQWPGCARKLGWL